MEITPEKHLVSKTGLAFADILSLAIRVFKTRPARTLLTILGMGFGSGVVLFLVSMGFGLQQILLGNLASTQDSLVTLETYYPPESGLKIFPEKVTQLENDKLVAEVSTVAEMPAEVGYASSSGVLLARIIGDNYYRLSGVAPKFFLDKDPRDGLVVTATALRLLGLTPSESEAKAIRIGVYYPKIETGLISGEVIIYDAGAFPIRGVIEDENEPPVVYIDSKLVKEQPPFFEKILIKSVDVEGVTTLRDKYTDAGFSVSARLDLVNQARKILTAITIILGVFGIAALIVSAIGMFNTMLIGFLERTFEVGIMKAIGAKDHDIRNIFLVESLLLGFLGGITGILIGYGGGALFNFGLNVMASRLGGRSVDLFQRPFWFIALIIVVASLIGTVAGIIPARRASKLSPKEAFAKK